MNKIQSNGSKGIHIQTLLKLVLAWLILAFVVYPNLNLLYSIFFQDGSFSSDAVRKVFKSARALKSLKNSFVLAFTLIVTVNIVGTLSVLFTEYWEIKGAGWLRLAYMSSLVYGGVVLVSGYKSVYGANGLVTKLLLQLFPNMNPNWFVGYGAVVFVMTFSCTQNHMMFLKNAIHSIDYYTVEAAKNMGASGANIFFNIVFPVLKPTFFAISILTFLTGLGAMSAPLIVGGENFQTINPMIITFSRSNSSRDVAALLAILLGAATILLLAVFSHIEKGGNYVSVSKTKAKLQKQKINNPILNAIAHIVAYAMFLIYLIPMVLVVVYSFCDSLSIKTGELSLSSFTLENYRKLFTSMAAFKPYLVSIVYSLLAALLAVTITVICARFVKKAKRKYDVAFEWGMLIPWLLPSTLIALGLSTTYGERHAIIFNQVLVGTLVLMLIGYVVVKLPFSYRMVKAAFFSIDDDLEEAAKCMGAGTVYTVVLMLLSAVALYFGQGDGMKRLQRWKQKRLEKKVQKMMAS